MPVNTNSLLDLKDGDHVDLILLLVTERSACKPPRERTIWRDQAVSNWRPSMDPTECSRN